MNKNTFALRVAMMEKGKKQVNIAQIKEIMKCINALTKGSFYKLLDETKSR